MIRFVLFMATFLFAFSVFAKDCNVVYNMQNRQVDTIIQSYMYGVEHDMGYSLAAIAWKESEAGLYPVNVSDPSFGVHHILIRSAMKRSGMKDTSFNRNRLASELLDHNTSAYFAVLELKYWLNYYGKDWEKVWASYNAGFNYKNGLKYSRDISNKIKQIDACIIKKQEVA